MEKIRSYSNLSGFKCSMKKLNFFKNLIIILILCTGLQLQATNVKLETNKEITGKVIDEAGLPMPGVNIYIEGNTNVGTQTNANGVYSLNVPDNAKKLVFSYIGYTVQTITIGNKTVINVTLKEESATLDEVVVTGYQTISKERATGSFVKISKEKLEERIASDNVLDRMESQVAGINFETDYDGDLIVRIRGKSTMMSNYYTDSQPLYVVDGFPIEVDLKTINPDDVESITVLKDASAASIWGAKAANGVIVITTKKGKQNQRLNIEFNARTTISEEIDFSKMNWMNSSETIDFLIEMDEKGYNADLQAEGLTGVSIGTWEEAIMHRKGYFPNGNVWTEAQFQDWVENARNTDNMEQYKDYLFRRSIRSSYALSISGGSAKNGFYGSLKYDDNLRTSIGDSDNKINFNLQDTYKFNDKVDFTAGLNLTYRRSQNNGFGVDYFDSQMPWELLVDENGQTIQYYNSHYFPSYYGNYFSSYGYNRYVSAEREAITGLSTSYNMLDYQRAQDNTTKQLNIRASFGLNLRVIKGLTFSSKFQFEFGNKNEDSFVSMDNIKWRRTISNFYVDDEFQIPVGTRYLNRTYHSSSWVFRNTINYDKTFGTDHKLTLFFGTEIRRIYNEDFYSLALGYDKQLTTATPINSKDLRGSVVFDWRGNTFREYRGFWDTNNGDTREFSLFSNFGYDYKGKYSLNASYRVDQKNLFGSDPDFRYKPLWSIGIGWNMHKEDFMQSVEWVDRLKLRTTYGLSGNASNRYSPYAQARNYISGYGGALFNYLSLNQAANPQLRWEETITFNVATDFSLFNNRLNGSIEYYIRKSNDLITSRQLDATNGFASAYVNYASMKNSGFEITLNGDILKTKDFKWSASLTFAYNKNIVTEVDAQNYGIWSYVYGYAVEKGLPLENMWTYNYGGLDDAGVIQLIYTDENGEQQKKPWHEDVSSKDELIYYGAKISPYTGGLNTKLIYKSWDLTMNITYKFGGYFNYSPYMPFAGESRIDKIYLDRWQKPGDELTTRIPKIPYVGINPYNGLKENMWDIYDANVFFDYSQDNIHSGSFVKIRDIILSYNVPKDFAQKLHLQSLKLSCQIQNPWFWAKNRHGIDPSTQYWGPRPWMNMKTITFGVKAIF